MKQFSVEVKVTQNHIDKAIKGDCGNCVIALAMIDAVARLKKVKKSTIEVSTISFDTALRVKKGTSFATDHPDHIHRLINDFDAGKRVEPTVFKAVFFEKNIVWH
jgi:hypothetical protein